MKYIITIFLAFISVHINAQYNPYDIREAIAESIEKLNTDTENAFRVFNKEISDGEFSIPISVYYPPAGGFLHLPSGWLFAKNFHRKFSITLSPSRLPPCGWLTGFTNSPVRDLHPLK
ncbi:MAG: hypothetical protein ACNS62_16470 [Candidatus Cyclobacteriaceae bacterium M3_2C_046]